MHEYAVTENIINTAICEAEKAGARRITEIRLTIGDLSSIVDESVQMYFDIISKDTAAEGARLIFRRLPAKFVCSCCGREYNKPADGFDCPVCGSPGRLTGAGREFYIESMEVDV